MPALLFRIPARCCGAVHRGILRLVRGSKSAVLSVCRSKQSQHLAITVQHCFVKSVPKLYYAAGAIVGTLEGIWLEGRCESSSVITPGFPMNLIELRCTLPMLPFLLSMNFLIRGCLSLEQSRCATIHSVVLPKVYISFLACVMRQGGVITLMCYTGPLCLSASTPMKPATKRGCHPSATPIMTSAP
jgi:hypothetical protein